MISKPAIMRRGDKYTIQEMLLKVKGQQLKSIFFYIQTDKSKPHGNQKPKTYNRYTHKKKNPNLSLKIVTQLQAKKAKEERNKKYIQINITGDLRYKYLLQNISKSNSTIH